mgnify:CR=1 FL=1
MDFIGFHQFITSSLREIPYIIYAANYSCTFWDVQDGALLQKASHLNSSTVGMLAPEVKSLPANPRSYS